METSVVMIMVKSGYSCNDLMSVTIWEIFSYAFVIEKSLTWWKVKSH